ncbi:hypothetical protein HAX54_004110 [Datura stramonium]|uniref:Uncharacterized protein n=1 Tax=Datura stramonium TaxID=4076 RepID=A0ABS8WUR9_DATST|nr:hypothetical protein [Datura stramonium]
MSTIEILITTEYQVKLKLTIIKENQDNDQVYRNKFNSPYESKILIKRKIMKRPTDLVVRCWWSARFRRNYIGDLPEQWRRRETTAVLVVRCASGLLVDRGEESCGVVLMVSFWLWWRR